jgi:hypothetical protein
MADLIRVGVCHNRLRKKYTPHTKLIRVNVPQQAV